MIEQIATCCGSAYWTVMHTIMETFSMTYGELCLLIWGFLCPISVILPETYLAVRSRHLSRGIRYFRYGFTAFMYIAYAIILIYIFSLPMDWHPTNIWDNMNNWLIEYSAARLGGTKSLAYGLFWGLTGVVFPLFCWTYYTISIIRIHRKHA